MVRGVKGVKKDKCRPWNGALKLTGSQQFPVWCRRVFSLGSPVLHSLFCIFFCFVLCHSAAPDESEIVDETENGTSPLIKR